MRIEKSDFVTKDYFKTQEEFKLVWNKDYQIFETQPQPELNKIGSYYESEAYSSHSNKVSSLMDLAYGIAKQLMLQKKLKWINSYTKATSVLDIGCGTGDLLWLLQKNNLEVVGVEPNEKAKQITSKKSIEVYSSLDEVKSKFDLVSMFHVLEHLHNPFTYVENLHHYLHNEAYVFVAVPNFNSYDAAYYKKHWAAFDVPRHLFHFSSYGIKKLFSEKGFLSVTDIPLTLDAFYVSLLSEKYKGTNSKLNAIKVALKSNSKARENKEWSSKLYIFQKSKN